MKALSVIAVLAHSLILASCSTLYASIMYWGNGNTQYFSTVIINPETGNLTNVAENIAVDGNMWEWMGISAIDPINNIYYYVLDAENFGIPPLVLSTDLTANANGPPYLVEGIADILYLSSWVSSPQDPQQILMLYITGNPNNATEATASIAELGYPTGPFEHIVEFGNMFRVAEGWSPVCDWDPTMRYYYVIMPRHENGTANWLFKFDTANGWKLDGLVDIKGCYNTEPQYIRYDPNSNLLVGGSIAANLPWSYWITIDPSTGHCQQTIIKQLGTKSIVSAWTYDISSSILYYFNMYPPFFLGTVNLKTGVEGNTVPMGADLIITMEISPN